MTLQHLTNDKAMQTLFGEGVTAGDKRIFLAENPFVTIQGEGPNIGKNTLFIRFFGCNLANSCGVDWCDSAHSFYTNKEIKDGFPDKPDRLTFADAEQMYEQIFEINNLSEFHNVVFTGGEPMLWQIQIAQLLQIIQDRYKRTISIEIETNGTIGIESELMDWFKMVHFNISPKLHVAKSFILLNQLQNVGHVGEAGYNYMRFVHDDWIVKFVVDDKKTALKNIEECVEKYKIKKDHIYLMAEGITQDEQNSKMKELAEYCINNGYNFSARLHVLIWNESKGV
jgi:6-pyruvoyltetrahydropterin 2'-reductase